MYIYTHDLYIQNSGWNLSTSWGCRCFRWEQNTMTMKNSVATERCSMNFGSRWPFLTRKWYTYDYRRKFRSETSDNMDSWKAEVRRVRRERVRGQKIQMREKVGKSRNTVFFQWFVAPEGRKVGSLKRRVRSPLARWEMKNCTPLWREAHFQVKMYKTPQLRTTFGSCDVEKVHAVVARSTFRSQNVQNTPGSDHFWKLRCRKVHAAVARSTFPSQKC